MLNAIIHFGLRDDDRYLGIMPQVHSAGLTFTLMHLYVCATVRILERFDPLQFLQVVERERVISTLSVPTMLALILDAQDKAGRVFGLSSLRRVVTCGPPLPSSTRQRVIDRIWAQLSDCCGCTDSNCLSVLGPAEQLRKPGSVRGPLRNLEFRIVAADGRALGAGEVGEIRCANPSVMTHCLGRPQIEQAMTMLPAVSDGAVLGVPDPVWGDAVQARVVLREGHTLILDEAQQHCMHYLASCKKPESLVVVSEIPRTARGKAMKSQLAGLRPGAA